MPAVIPRAASAQQASGDTRVLSEVVVTGSRLEQRIDEAVAPVVVLDATQLRFGGNDSIGKALQRLPQNTGSPGNTNVNRSDSPGAVRIDLRGFGPNRTLVLLNGRRIGVSGLGGDSSVDLDTIPASLIERVEVSTGASAIYGADAVAGVVNIITRSRFEGLEVEGTSLSSTRGDGDIRAGRALMGAAGQRGSIAAGVELVDQHGVKQSDRAYSRTVLDLEEPNGPLIQGGSDFTPQGFIRVSRDNAFGFRPGRLTVVTGHTGTGGASDFRPLEVPADSWNYAPYNYLQMPSRRVAGWAFGNFQLSSVQPFFEAYYSRRQSQRVLAPTPYWTREPGAAPAVAGGAGGQGIPADNFYNPFEADVLAVGRRTVEIGDRFSEQNVDAWRAVAGVRGDLRGWSWELSYARSDQTADQHSTGDVLRSRALLAVGPSGPDAGGNIVCGARDPATGVVPPEAVIAGCVPLNLFGGQGVDGKGSITPEQAAYVSLPLTDRGENRSDAASFSITGALGSLPAGKPRVALGLEWREEFTRLSFDPIEAGAGVSGGNLTDLPQGASFDATAFFAETEIPLIANMRFARELAVNVGARYSRFSSFGSDVSLRNGVRWEVLPGVSLRGNYSQVFRAPGLAELYTRDTLHDEFVLDPCGQGETTSAQQAHCAANGVPDGSYVQEDPPLITNRAGGNPELTPESGASSGVGLVLRPSSLPQLLVSLDYWRITLADAIGMVTGQEIVDECANSGVQAICSRITRAADGAISEIDARSVNLGNLAGKGYDLGVDWQAPALGGEWSAHLITSYLARLDTTPVPGAQTLRLAGEWDDDTVGRAFPHWRSLGYVDWSRGRWRLRYGLEYVGPYRECGTFDEPGSVCYRRVEARLYHDVEVGWEALQGLSVTAAITNLTGEEPPLVLSGDANTDVASYRLLGRTYALRVGYHFR